MSSPFQVFPESSHPGTASAVLGDAANVPVTRGSGSLMIRHNKSGVVWRIKQMAVSCVPVGLLTLETVFNGLPAMSPVTVFSGSAADGEPSMDLGDQDTLEVRVTNGPPAANVILAYFYQEINAMNPNVR